MLFRQLIAEEREVIRQYISPTREGVLAKAKPNSSRDMLLAKVKPVAATQQ
jgi:hypothetical protein